MLYLLSIASCVVVALLGEVGAFELSSGRRCTAVNKKVCMSLQSDSEPVSTREAEMAVARGVRNLFAVGAISLTSLWGAQRANALPAYLPEPTDAFKDQTKLTAAAEGARGKQRADWDKIFNKFEATQDPAVLEAQLRVMVVYLKGEDGIPPGFLKKELVKRCRAKKLMKVEGKRKPKNRPEWTKEVEISYQAMIQQFDNNASPGKVKDPAGFTF